MSTSSSAESYTYATVKSDEEIVLEFKQVRAWVDNFKAAGSTEAKRRDILRGVGGTLRSGELTMCAGASGAGKSTLLDVLASRATTVESSGLITVNGHPFGLTEFQEMSAYVTQDAVFLNSLTPGQILTFKAQMLLPTTLSREEKKARVDDVIDLLGLEPVRNVRLGEPGVSAHGLNFVQRKRLNIAASLLVNPRILFVDEPTTGLDAAAARQVMLSLKRVAKERSIIVFATVHQPSVFVFNLFDKCIVMALGQVAFEGPVADVVPYLADNGYPCPKFKNPADHLIQVLDSKDGDTARVQQLIDSRAGGSSSESAESSAAALGGIAGITGVSAHRIGLFHRLYLLVKRSVMVTLSNQQGMQANVGQAIAFGVLIGLLYDLDLTQAGALNRPGLLFLTVTNAIFLSAQSSIFVFISERAVFLREVADGSYSLALYAISKLVADLPFQIAYQVIFASVLYFWAGLQADFGKFLIFVLIHCLVALGGSNLGLCLSALTGDGPTATALTPVVVVPSMLTSGVLVSRDTMPVWLEWLRHISILRYAFSAALLNEADDGLTFTCDASERTPSGLCPINNGKELISSRDANDDPDGISFRLIMLAAFYVLSAIGAVAGLLFSTRNQKKTKNEAASSS